MSQRLWFLAFFWLSWQFLPCKKENYTCTRDGVFQRRGSGTVTTLCTWCSQSLTVKRRFRGARNASPACSWAGKGSSTFSLRWIRVKGMVCLSWGLLFLVSCWMGSAMSATEPHSSHLRLRAAETALKCASFLWGLWDWFCLLSAREDKTFPRRTYLGSAPVLLGAGFPLPFPVLAATQVSMESFGCAPFPASVQGTFPIPATLLLLDSAVSTWSKFRLAALVHRLKEIMQWELISKGCLMSTGVFVTVVALTSILAGGHK